MIRELEFQTKLKTLYLVTKWAVFRLQRFMKYINLKQIMKVLLYVRSLKFKRQTFTELMLQAIINLTAP